MKISRSRPAKVLMEAYDEFNRPIEVEIPAAFIGPVRFEGGDYRLELILGGTWTVRSAETPKEAP